MKPLEFIACLAVICLTLAPFIGLGLFVYKQTKEAIFKVWKECNGNLLVAVRIN